MKILNAIFLILVAFTGLGQKVDSIQSKRFPAYIIKSTIGVHNANNLSFTDPDWERRTPGVFVPDSFQVNPEGVNQFPIEQYKLYWMHSISWIHHKEKQAGRNYRFTALFHVGIGPQVHADKYWFHENREVLDTLISSQTGEVYYVTGNIRQDIQKSYRSKSFLLGFGEHFATNPESLFQFETGIDAFMMFNSNVTESSVNESYLIEGIAPGNYNPLNPVPAVKESQRISHKGKALYGMMVRIPLELSIPLSYKNPVLKRMRLGVELNAGCALYFTNGQTNLRLSANSGINFRYEIFDINTHFLSKSRKQVSN